MKTISLYFIAFLTLIAFAACDEDFKDWADPQSHEQEEAVTLHLEVANASSASFNLNTITADSVEIAGVTSITLPEGSSALYKVSVATDDTFETMAELPAVGTGNVIKVSTADLEEAVWAFYGKKGEEHNLKLNVDALVVSANGDASKLKGGVLDINVITQTLPIETAYYIIGDVVGSWEPEDVVVFNSLGEGMFELELEVPKDKANFVIIPQSGVDAGEDEFWDTALGTAKNEDTSSTGTLVSKRGDQEVGNIQIASASKKKITLNMNDYTYRIDDIVETMFIIGSPWDWKWENVGESMTVVNGVKGKFWSIQYFSTDSEIKFCPIKAWGSDFGYNDANISSESITFAGLSDAGGNIKIGNAGWYIVVVTQGDSGYTVEFLEAAIWLIGGASNGGWDAIGTNPADKFEIPSGPGEFVSPAFANATTELRMAIILNGVDWWRTEFIVLDGKIAYRGNGGDQDRVSVVEGQKAYLDFTTGEGRIE